MSCLKVLRLCPESEDIGKTQSDLLTDFIIFIFIFLFFTIIRLDYYFLLGYTGVANMYSSDEPQKSRAPFRFFLLGPEGTES